MKILSESDIFKLRLIYREIILNERPLIISPFSDGFEPLDDVPSNRAIAKQVIESEKEVKIGNFRYSVYFLRDEGTIYVINKKEPYICAKFVSNHVSGGGIGFSYVWNGLISGVARETVFGYFLKNYKYVQSDNLQTPLGAKYWKKLIEESLKRGFVVQIYDILTGNGHPVNSLKLEEFYGDLESGKNVEREKFVFRIFPTK